MSTDNTCYCHAWGDVTVTPDPETGINRLRVPCPEPAIAKMDGQHYCLSHLREAAIKRSAELANNRFVQLLNQNPGYNWTADEITDYLKSQ